MTGAARQGPRRGWWAWWGDLIQRGLLGKSAPGYMRRFTGDDAYWAAALAAQERCASAADGGPRGAEAQGAGDPTAARGPDPAGRRPVMPPASPAEPGAAPP